MRLLERLVILSSAALSFPSIIDISSTHDFYYQRKIKIFCGREDEELARARAGALEDKS